MLLQPSIKPVLVASLSLALGLALSPLSHAGKATIMSAEGSSAEFEYAGDKLRIDMPGGKSYMLIRDGAMYVVSFEGGAPMVFNASEMMKGMASQPGQMAPSALNAEFVSLEDTGNDETVAGMAGDIYTFTFRDENGEERSEEVVLTSDARAIEFRDALFSMSAIAEELTTEDVMKQGRDLQERLESMKVGVLRYGKEMYVSEMSGEEIPAERFELPAQPMDMQGLGNMLKGLQKP